MKGKRPKKEKAIPKSSFGDTKEHAPELPYYVIFNMQFENLYQKYYDKFLKDIK